MDIIKDNYQVDDGKIIYRRANMYDNFIEIA